MPYRILSLDGGGSWALIQARVLLDIYGDEPGHKILGNFDLVIANSGGSMVLAALVSNLRPSQIISVFQSVEDRKKVFSKLGFWEAPLTGIARSLGFGARYKAVRKREGLRKVLQKYTGSGTLLAEQPMSAIPAVIGRHCPEMIVCGYNYYTERAVFFRSNTNSNTDGFSDKHYDVSLLDAVHAASNAPLNYFDESAVVMTGLTGTPLKTPSWYWDGAVGGFNNPVMAGVVEAITNGKGRTAGDFRILSLGTAVGRRPVIVGWDKGTPEQQAVFNANKENDLVISKPQTGFKTDLGKMATSILADPPDSATFIAYSMLQPDLKQGACIVRINPCINPVRHGDLYVVPEAWGNTRRDKERFAALLDLDMDAVEDSDVALIMELCDKFIVNDPARAVIPNQFIRGDGSGPRYLGYGKYYEAKRKWMEGTSVM